MTDRAYRQFRTLNAVFLVSASTYLAVLMGLNALTLYFQVLPLLLYLIPVFVGSVFLLTTLLPRPQKRGALCALASPTLEKSLAAICRDGGLAKTPRVSALFAPNASAFVANGAYHVAVGLPLLCAYSSSELDFVIAHEVAHHLHHDTTRGRVAHRLEDRIERIGALFRHRFAAAILLPFRPAFLALLRAVKKARRDSEFEADAFAARLTGKASALAALRKLTVLDDHWKLFLDRWVWFAVDAGVAVDLVMLYTAFAQRLALDDLEPSAVPSSVAHLYASHPAPAERLEHVLAIDADQGAADPAPHLVANTRELSEFWYAGLLPRPIAIVENVEQAYRSIGEAVLRRYGRALQPFRWSDLAEIAWRYSDYSSRFFEITRVDDHHTEWKVFVFLVSYLAWRGSNQPLNLGPTFTPRLNIGETWWDLGDDAARLAGGPLPGFTERLQRLGLNGPVVPAELQALEGAS